MLSGEILRSYKQCCCSINHKAEVGEDESGEIRQGQSMKVLFTMLKKFDFVL